MLRTEPTPRSSWARPFGEAGFTVVQAVIALLLSSLVVGLGYASYTFLSRMVVQWNDRVAVENTVHRIARDVTRRAHRAEEVRVEQAGWTFVADGRTTAYQHEEDLLRRNGRPAHDERIDVVAFSIEVLEPQAPRSSDERESEPLMSEGQDRRAVTGAQRHLRLRVTGATQTDTLTLRTAVYLRQPEMWSGPASKEGLLEPHNRPPLSPQRSMTREPPS